MTDQELQSIRERVNKAEQGPWEFQPDYEAHDESYAITSPNVIVLRDTGYLLDEDAEFIAHAREDVPTLLAEVDRLRNELKRIQSVGHNDDCMFCGFKDKAAIDALA